MPESSELAELYREAARVTALGSRSFYFATRFLPRDLARAAHAVYWFCRYTDDLVDECGTVEQGRRDLEKWAGRVEAALRGCEPSHPVLKVFLDTARAKNIPSEYPLELIEGMRMDLNGTRYRNFAELRTFCYRVASVVGLMMSHAIGFEDPALDYAIDLGIAMQLTNILRDIAEDWQRGRVYLPSEEMERFGYSERALAGGERTPEFRALMRFQVARARDYYDRAVPGIALLDPRGRFAVQVAADVYREILSVIEARDYDVFGGRAIVPPTRKWWISGRSMAMPVARHSAARLKFWRAWQS
jgi:15-cis-phytoene synthase